MASGGGASTAFTASARQTGPPGEGVGLEGEGAGLEGEGMWQ